MGQNPICYTKAYELMGKGVGTGLVGLYYRLACAQARHAQCLDRAEKCYSKLDILASATGDVTAE